MFVNPLLPPSTMTSFFKLKVGHTGKYTEAVRGVEATDTAIGRIHATCEELGIVLFVTADHGNAEQVLYYMCVCYYYVNYDDDYN